MLGLKTTAGVASQRAHEQPLGLVVFDVIVALTAAPAIGLAEFLPAAGRVNGATELFLIDKRFDGLNRMSVSRLPVRAEPIQSQSQNSRAQIGHREIWEDQKARIVGDEAQAATALLVGPTDVVITVFEMLGRRAEYQHGNTLIGGTPGDVVQPFTHRTKTAQVMVFI